MDEVQKITTEKHIDRDYENKMGFPNTPLVSVIMPAYNSETVIEEAIESVLAQTYFNWELLILDDHSADRTGEIARYYEGQDTRIHYISSQKNVGTARIRNHGISLAQGDWIALLDSDDRWHREKLEKQLDLAQRTEASIVYTSYLLFESDQYQQTAYLVPETTDYEQMLLENVIGCSTAMIRRSVFEEHRFSTEVSHEDYALWLELLKAGFKACGCREILVDWRISDQSRSYDKRKSAMDRWYIYRRIEKLPLGKSIYSFFCYARNGVKKYKRLKFGG